ncbi:MULTISPECIES: ferritin-like domain-containing protein [Chitinophagaceae]|uniref:YciE/YciF ferroxidase family protein n=1 Tax=Chitinophagaceae TaxID=563835 RepID=UPI000DEF6BEE|nr:MULTISPECIES: ferritin-like domain-containing protein [Chitinophagaceae]RPD51304.1 ferritin-like domain-containing protein [Paracnuella aquatica]
MEKMRDLRDLLIHELADLRSAEEQIIEAMPQMIGKAHNPQLRQSLEQHLQITHGQLARLEQAQRMLGDHNADDNRSGLLANLFGSGTHCKGMEGLIDEGQKVMGEDMNPEVMDAAIISCAQKIEHYEICGYGTARAFARQLGLTEVERLLEQTLDEEHQADELLTSMALNSVNLMAETSGGASGNTSYNKL